MTIAQAPASMMQVDPIRRAALLLLRHEIERESDALLARVRETVDELVGGAQDRQLLETAQMESLRNISLHHQRGDIQTYVRHQQRKVTPNRADGWAYNGLGMPLGDFLADTLDDVAEQMPSVKGRARKRLEAMFATADSKARHEAIEEADAQLETGLQLVRTYLRHFTIYYALRAQQRSEVLRAQDRRPARRTEN